MDEAGIEILLITSSPDGCTQPSEVHDLGFSCRIWREREKSGRLLAAQSHEVA